MQRGSSTLEGPIHKEMETSEDLTLERNRIRVNNQLNGNKRKYVTSAGINISTPAEASWGSALDVVKWERRSLTTHKLHGTARATLQIRSAKQSYGTMRSPSN